VHRDASGGRRGRAPRQWHWQSLQIDAAAVLVATTKFANQAILVHTRGLVVDNQRFAAAGRALEALPASTAH
jgi:hypothetical protein